MKVNFLKSVLIGIRIGELQIKAFANLVGVKVGSFLASYLGLPLSIVSLSRALCDPLIGRVECKLTSWKAKYSSFEGQYCTN